MWGATPDEVAGEYGCAAMIDGPVASMFRAVDVAAPAPITFRWVCQVRAAPYSYDLIDNLGRRSPRTLTPGLDHLEAGQRFAVVFRIAAVEPGRSITAVTTGRGSALFGPVAVTYRVTPAGADRCRLVARLDVGTSSPVRRVSAVVLAWGDLVMMRKQLRTLRACAEASSGRLAS